MKENAINSSSKTNWEKVDSLTEEEIDTSDTALSISMEYSEILKSFT